MSPTSILAPEVSEEFADTVVYILCHTDDFLALVPEFVISRSNLPDVGIDRDSGWLVQAEKTLRSGPSQRGHTTQSATFGPTPDNSSRDSLAMGYDSRRREVSHPAGFS
jgi:hypothetical protein